MYIISKMDTVIKQLKEYHYKNTEEYMKKLEDSDSEEYWDEYVLRKSLYIVAI